MGGFGFDFYQLRGFSIEHFPQLRDVDLWLLVLNKEVRRWFACLRFTT